MNISERVRPKAAISVGIAANVRGFLIWTTGVEVSFANLEDQEQRDLVELVGKAELRDSKGLDWKRFSRGEKKRFIGLLERGAGLEPGEFARRDQAAKEAAQFRELGRQAKLMRRVRFEEQGSIRLPKEVFDELAHVPPQITIEMIGLLCSVALQLENMKPLSYGSRIEGEGDDAALTLDKIYGVGGLLSVARDGYVDWQRDIEHLAVNKWLRVEARGRDVVIRRGPKWLKHAKAES